MSGRARKRESKRKLMNGGRMSEVIKSNGSVELTGKSASALHEYCDIALDETGKPANPAIVANLALRKGLKANASYLKTMTRNGLADTLRKLRVNGAGEEILARAQDLCFEKMDRLDAYIKSVE